MKIWNWFIICLLFTIIACSLIPSPANTVTPTAVPHVSGTPNETTPGQPSVETEEQSSPTMTVFDTGEPLQLPMEQNSVIQPSDLEYLGAFRLPDETSGSTWDYSGRGLTYYPNGDPEGKEDGFPGSLFGTGNDQENFVSEITIPVPVLSKNLDDLNTADTIQPFADITEGLFGETDIPRLGIQYLPAQGEQTSGKLHFVHGQHIQGFEPSHGWSELTLEHPQPAGPWIFDGYTNYVTSDYVFEIPVEWSVYLSGSPRLVTGRYREGVWAGRGPTLFAYTPSASGEPPPANATLTGIIPLLLYGIQEPAMTDIVSNETMQMINHNEDDSWWGGAWLTSGERAAVIFVGTKALGKSWYGFANGVVWEYDCAEQDPPTCPDPPEFPYENRGYWADDYQPQVLFYNPVDLVAVGTGQMETWEPQPYATLDLTATFFNPEINLAAYKYEIAGAVAYDRERGLLYIIERLADSYKSIIHVWKITEPN